MDDKYLEYFAAMVDELRKLNAKFGKLNEDIDSAKGQTDSLSDKIKRIEIAQQETHALLAQKTFYLKKIKALLEH